MVDQRRKAIFLDRDGVICVNRPDYVKSWDEFVFLDNARAALRRLKENGLPVVVISNQSCIGRGIVSQNEVDEINQQMNGEIAKAGGLIERIYVCPHRIDEGCSCRKPEPGLLIKAAEELHIDLGASYFIGDAKSDMLAGKAAGTKNVLVLTGLSDHQSSLEELKEAGPDHIAKDLKEAVDWIVHREQKGT